MDKKWADLIKEKVDSYNSRVREIEKTLAELFREIEYSPHNLRGNYEMYDERHLVWKVRIGKQEFLISEEEIAKKQNVWGVNELGEAIDTGEKLSVKKALEDIILEKLKSF